METMIAASAWSLNPRLDAAVVTRWVYCEFFLYGRGRWGGGGCQVDLARFHRQSLHNSICQLCIFSNVFFKILRSSFIIRRAPCPLHFLDLSFSGLIRPPGALNRRFPAYLPSWMLPCNPIEDGIQPGSWQGFFYSNVNISPTSPSPNVPISTFEN